MKTQLVIFGITGDLAGRKLLPALDTIVGMGNDNELSIVGVSRREVDETELLKAHPKLAPHTTVYTMDLARKSDYDGLKTMLEAESADQTLFYLSVPPGAAADIVDFLGEAGLNGSRYKVLFEKPFGYDLASAHEFIDRTARYFHDEQLYRIDHYAAKEMAAEVLRLRRNAENHHHTWSNRSIASVRVVASEAIGIEGRAQFYEQTGALRDFLQGHLLQLLALVLITSPGTAPLAAERREALRLIEPVDPRAARRAQYDGYEEEVVNPGSTTETFAALPLKSRNPLWEGVELSIITGKALNEKRSYIEVTYRDGTIDVFEEGLITPPEGQRSLDAYERVLLEAIAGRHDIFTTGPEVIRAWEIVAPVQEAWGMDGEPIGKYSPGSSIEKILTV